MIPWRAMGLFLLAAHFAVAIPRFAINEGATCSTCHINPTGGGLRNEYGVLVVSSEELPLKTSTEKDWGALSDHIRIGADVRVQMLSYAEGDASRRTTTIPFPMQTDFYGYLAANKWVEAYVGIDVLRKNHEAWISLNALPFDGYVQMGRKMLAYGLTLDDHTSFIRGGNIRRTHGLRKEGLPFSPLTPPAEIVEVGMTISNMFLVASLSNGFIYGKEKTATVRGEYSNAWESFSCLAGASFLREQSLTLAGIFGGFSFRSLTWSGEMDIAQNWIGTGISLASYSEVAFEARQGVQLLAKFDFFDVDIDYMENALTRYTIGMDLFLLTFLEIKAQTRLTSVSGSESPSRPEFLLQFHTWL